MAGDPSHVPKCAGDLRGQTLLLGGEHAARRRPVSRKVKSQFGETNLRTPGKRS